MFFDDKKKDIGAILRSRKQAVQAGPVVPETTEMDPLHAIAGEVCDAVHAKDHQALMHALHAFMLEASTKE